MGEFVFHIIEGNTLVATATRLDFALIIAKALFEEYYNEDHMNICIERKSKVTTTLIKQEM